MHISIGRHRWRGLDLCPVGKPGHKKDLGQRGKLEIVSLFLQWRQLMGEKEVANC